MFRPFKREYQISNLTFYDMVWWHQNRNFAMFNINSAQLYTPLHTSFSWTPQSHFAISINDFIYIFCNAMILSASTIEARNGPPCMHYTVTKIYLKS